MRTRLATAFVFLALTAICVSAQPYDEQHIFATGYDTPSGAVGACGVLDSVQQDGADILPMRRIDRNGIGLAFVTYALVNQPMESDTSCPDEIGIDYLPPQSGVLPGGCIWELKSYRLFQHSTRAARDAAYAALDARQKATAFRLSTPASGSARWVLVVQEMVTHCP